MRSAKKREVDEAAAAAAHAQAQKAKQQKQVDPIVRIAQAYERQASAVEAQQRIQQTIAHHHYPDLIPPPAAPKTAAHAPAATEEAKVPRSRRLPGPGRALGLVRGAFNLARRWRRNDSGQPELVEVVVEEPTNRGYQLPDHTPVIGADHQLPLEHGIREVSVRGSERDQFKVVVEGLLTLHQLDVAESYGWSYLVQPNGTDRYVTVLISKPRVVREAVEILRRQLGI